MTPEELETLGKKVVDGTATDKEKLVFLKELNAEAKKLREDIRTVSSEK